MAKFIINEVRYNWSYNEFYDNHNAISFIALKLLSRKLWFVCFDLTCYAVESVATDVSNVTRIAMYYNEGLQAISEHL